MVHDVAPLHVQRLATRVQPAEVEQRAHLPQQLLGILVDILQLSQQIVGSLTVRQLFHDLFQRRYDECQRRAQVVADIGEELQFHLRNLFHLLSLHQLALPFRSLPLSFAHVAPLQIQGSQNNNCIQYVHGQRTIEWRCHADAQFPWCAHGAVLTTNAQLQGVVARRQGIERHVVVVGHCPAAHQSYQPVGIAYALDVLQTAREEFHGQVGCIMAKIDGCGLFVQQAVAYGNLTDHEVAFFVFGSHQPSRFDAHVSFCAAHQYLALGRTNHSVAVEIELRHAG